MIEEARNELSLFLKESGKTQRQVSRETGLSATVISQFLGGSYPGDNEEVARVVSQYLTVGKERLRKSLEPVFFEQLHNTRDVLFACGWAHRNNDMVLVSGAAGAGKSTALQHYARSHAGVVLVTANACTTTPAAILGLISQAIGHKPTERRAALMSLLVEQLSGTGWLIIIDEADHLSLAALQSVRNLNDMAGCGVVLSGNDKIWRQMFSARRGYEFDQLRTRLVVRKWVSNDYTTEEIQGIFPNLDQGSTGFLLQVAKKESLRTAVKLFQVAAQAAAAQGVEIGARLLRDTQRQMMGQMLVEAV